MQALQIIAYATFILGYLLFGLGFVRGFRPAIGSRAIEKHSRTIASALIVVGWPYFIGVVAKTLLGAYGDED